VSGRTRSPAGFLVLIAVAAAAALFAGHVAGPRPGRGRREGAVWPSAGGVAAGARGEGGAAAGGRDGVEDGGASDGEAEEGGFEEEEAARETDGGSEAAGAGTGRGAGNGKGTGAGTGTGTGRTAEAGTGRGSAAPAARSPTSTAEARDERPPEPNGSLFGRVCDAAGEGIASAQVRLVAFRSSYNRGTTDVDGRFRLDGVRPGRYRLLARAAGFADGELPAPVDVAAGRPSFAGDLVLRASGAVRGWVFDPEGAPLGGARVRPDRGGAFGAIEAVSGADGRFELSGLLAGKAKITATHEAWLPSAAVAIEIPALEDGSPGSVDDVVLTMRRGAAIEGSVFFADGRIASVDVTLYDAGGRRLRSLIAGGAYAFEGLAAGRYSVLGGPRDGLLAREDVALSAGERRRADLVFAAAAAIAGAVVGPDGGPVGGVRVTAFAQGLDFRPSADTGAHGRFRIESAVDATYVLRAEPPPLYARPDPITIEVAGGKSPPEVTIELGAGAALSGRVAAPDGGPAGGASVEVYEAGGPRRLAGTTADPAGRFRLASLSPGLADVYVRGPGGLARERVALAAGEEREVELPLAAAARIRGRAAVDGGPAAGARIAATSVEDVVRRAARSNRVGDFELGDLYPGRYRLGATLGERSAPPAEVEVGPGQVLEGVELTIR
jgi:hypothetical protein